MCGRLSGAARAEQVDAGVVQALVVAGEVTVSRPGCQQTCQGGAWQMRRLEQLRRRQRDCALVRRRFSSLMKLFPQLHMHSLSHVDDCHIDVSRRVGSDSSSNVFY